MSLPKSAHPMTLRSNEAKSHCELNMSVLPRSSPPDGASGLATNTTEAGSGAGFDDVDLPMGGRRPQGANNSSSRGGGSRIRMSLFDDYGGCLREEEEQLLARDLRAWIFNEGDHPPSGGGEGAISLLNEGDHPPGGGEGAISLLDAPPLPPPPSAPPDTALLLTNPPQVILTRTPHHSSLGLGSQWGRAFSVCSLILSDTLMDFMDLELPGDATEAAVGVRQWDLNGRQVDVGGAHPGAEAAFNALTNAQVMMNPGGGSGDKGALGASGASAGGVGGSGGGGMRVRGLSMQLEAGGHFESSVRLSNLCHSVMGSLSNAYHVASRAGSFRTASMMDFIFDDEDLLTCASVPELASLMLPHGQQGAHGQDGGGGNGLQYPAGWQQSQQAMNNIADLMVAPAFASPPHQSVGRGAAVPPHLGRTGGKSLPPSAASLAARGMLAEGGGHG